MSGRSRKRIRKETDVTSQLPDEVLCHLLTFLSLSDKLHLESLNRKFQRCVLRDLNDNPQPLQFDGINKTLNGYKVSEQQLLTVVQSFGSRAKFACIKFEHMDSCAWDEGRLDSILSLLIDSENKCLSKVKTYESSAPCSQRVLQYLLAKCGKLSTFCLNFDVRPLYSAWAGVPWSGVMDLAHVLTGRALTEIKLTLNGYVPEDLMPIFQAIKPHTLKKLQLELREMRMVKLVDLVNELSGNGWAALEELHLDCPDDIDGPLQQFLDSLAHLPTLRLCNLEIGRKVQPNNEEVIPGLAALFESKIPNLSVGWFSADLTGCQVHNLLVGLQSHYPGIQLEYQTQIHKLHFEIFDLTFVLDNVRSKTTFFPVRCNDANCVHCRHFYPTVVQELGKGLMSAHKRKAGEHLAGYQLDESRVDHVVDDLNVWYGVGRSFGEISAQVNDDTVRVGNVTIDCGHCLSNPCIH